MPAPWSRYAVALLFLLFFVVPAPVRGEEATAPDVTAKEVAATYREALAHAAAGNTAQAADAYARVLEFDPEHRAARRALGYEEVGGYWLKGDDLWRAKGFVHHGGRWLTAEEFADATRPERESEEQRAGEARVLALLADVASEEAARVESAKQTLENVSEHLLLAPLAKALRCEPPSLRCYVAARLGRLGDARAVPALLKRTIVDPDESVRRAAAVAIGETGTRDAVHPLGRALWSNDANVRVRAAEALGHIGDVSAAPYLIGRWDKRSGNFTRVYFTQVKQVSYIQDFDVEVASTSFIADPIVGVLQEGVVQAFKVLATEVTFSSVERVAYRSALGRIAGEDLGDDVKAWQKWLRSQP